jgi:flagellar protein FlaG
MMAIQLLNTLTQSILAANGKGAPAVAAPRTDRAAAGAMAGTPHAAPDPAQITQALITINTVLHGNAQDLEFAVDPDSDRTIIRVIDQQTKEVLRQIPSEEVLEIARALDRLRQGMLIRQKA